MGAAPRPRPPPGAPPPGAPALAGAGALDPEREYQRPPPTKATTATPRRILFIEFRDFPIQSSPWSSIDAAPTAADALYSLELGHGVEVADDGPQFRQALRGQVGLRLDDVVVGRHADLEPDLFGLGIALGHVAGFLRGLILLIGILDCKPGVGDLRRDGQFLRLDLRQRLIDLQLGSGPRDAIDSDIASKR